MLIFIQRYYLLAFVVLSGLCGLALGKLVAVGLEIRFEPPLAGAQISAPPIIETGAEASLADYAIILQRDIFNPAGGEQKFTPASLEPVASDQPAAVKRSSTKWQLIGTVAGTNALAILSDGKETYTTPLHGELPDGAKVGAIERNRVTLEFEDGSSLVLEIQEVTPLATVNSREPVARLPVAQQNSSQIESLDENRWLIPAEVAENARENVGDLLKQAQAIPYLEDGQTTGFELRMIQAGSLIAQLGLQKGDILREVNGLPLNSPEKALQVFGQLRQASQISIGLERKGEAMTFAYEIR
jgi:general secretion pathway protein C